MTVSYVQDADALSIIFRDTTVTTEHLADGIAAEYDAEGNLAGIESWMPLSAWVGWIRSSL